MHHVIQRQIIAINTHNVETANTLQQRIDTFFKTQAMTMMDEVLSSFSQAGTLIRLEKLELDLGTLSLEILETQFTQRLKEQLTNALQKEISSHEDISNVDVNTPKNSEKTHLIITQSEEKSAHEQLLYFLQQGVLPWWSRDNKAFSLQALLDSVLEKEPTEFIHQLQAINNLHVVERLVMQFTPTTYYALLAQLAKSNAQNNNHEVINAIKQWLSILEESPLELRQMAQLKAHLLSFLLQHATEVSSVAALSAYIDHTLLAYDTSMELAHTKKMLTAWMHSAQRLLIKNSEIYQWLKQKKATLIVDSITITHDANKHNATADVALNYRNVNKDNLTQDKTPSANKPTQKPQKIPLSLWQHVSATNTTHWENKAHYYYINNAGIILLWSFLPRYFTTLALLKNNAFIDEICQEKAVLLLHYLVSGKTEAEEYSLILSKLLCGWPLEKPLLRTIALTQQEHQESEALILAVIEHWQALKQTSIAGLRQSFLQREGRLTEKEQGWNLLVKRTGFDILLEQLPWGISILRLPWMKKTVFVEW